MKNWQADLIKIAAVLTAAPRWAGALMAADVYLLVLTQQYDQLLLRKPPQFLSVNLLLLYIERASIQVCLPLQDKYPAQASLA